MMISLPRRNLTARRVLSFTSMANPALLENAPQPTVFLQLFDFALFICSPARAIGPSLDFLVRKVIAAQFRAGAKSKDARARLATANLRVGRLASRGEASLAGAGSQAASAGTAKPAQ
jgi:hypothetical protein